MPKKNKNQEIEEDVKTPGTELEERLLEEEYLKSEKEKMNTLQFCINLMKGIAGTGSLGVPYAFAKIGILLSLFLFVLICGMMILATYQLIQINNNIGNRRILGLKSIRTNNVYAELVFNVLGTTGYYVYVASSLVTLYGSNVGSMIVMTDFLEVLPIGSNVKVRRIICQIILTIICIILCLLKDPSLLVPISSLGLGAISIGFIALIIYGFKNYKITFTPADLFPTSFTDVLQNIGIFVYCMGFILFLLTQYKHIRRDAKKTVIKSTGISITIMAIIYATVGILLSQLYKNGPQGVMDNIIKSLPNGEFLAIPVNIMLAITVVGGFPLWMEPINETVEGSCGEMTAGKYFITNKTYIMIRIIEICAISLIAYIMPFFGDILALIGNFTDVITTFIFPAVMHIVFFRNRCSKLIMGLDFATLTFSVIVMVVCTSVSLKKLIKKLKE